MIDKFDFTNAETSAVYHLNDDISGFIDLEFSVGQRTDRSRKRTVQHGIWSTFTYRDEMEIHIEGDLIANDASDYVTKRLALLAALFGTGSTLPTVRKSGTLAIRMTGQTEDFTCDVTIDAFSAPQVGGYPGYSKYLLTFFNPLPYLTGASSGNKIYWA